ncbi:hypothetical protein M885DRAFT_620581 [Pelagophyceae sp. CCMP2097]|nr:hypothetical protein M885DRAFT_620581 [Pelagophyceae sp. CCMP2097]
MGLKEPPLQLFDAPLRMDYGTTYLASNAGAAAYAPAPRVRARINKNASDSQTIIDNSGRAGGVTFAATSKLAQTADTTVLAHDYIRARPARDRRSASQTNYSLGAQQQPYSTQASRTFCRGEPVQQADIGGWRNADGSHKVDRAAMESLRRGGGGGEGSLGVGFDVITGAPRPRKRDDKLASVGPMRTLNTGARALDYGDGRVRFNPVTGRDERAHAAPPRDTAATLRRLDQPALLRTRPW